MEFPEVLMREVQSGLDSVGWFSGAEDIDVAIEPITQDRPGQMVHGRMYANEEWDGLIVIDVVPWDGPYTYETQGVVFEFLSAAAHYAFMLAHELVHVMHVELYDNWWVEDDGLEFEANEAAYAVTRRLCPGQVREMAQDDLFTDHLTKISAQVTTERRGAAGKD